MANLVETYAKAFSDSCLLDPASWFEDETPAEQMALLDNLTVAADIAEAMLLSGETYWSHLAWWKDVYQVLKQWCASPNGLIKTRLLATWLQSTVPAYYPDSDCTDLLTQLALGNFCEVFTGLSSRWPQTPEFYRQRQQWSMAEVAEEDAQRDWTIANAAVHRRTGSVIRRNAA